MMLTFTSCTSNALRGEKSIKIDELPDIDVPGVYYEIFVGGFSDSDEDGTGDIKGIINRINYLNDGDHKREKSWNRGNLAYANYAGRLLP